MLENFIDFKNDILNFSFRLKKSKCIENDMLYNSIFDKCISKLEEGSFKIALIAPFSAGKSTFINSLIGQALLSMEITAETSVITKVKYSKRIYIEIYYRNGTTEIIPPNKNDTLTISEAKEILKLKTTVKGRNNEDKINEVIVYYPVDICQDNIEIIDTPGLFARFEKHKLITTNVFPSVDTVIFMIDPESVGEQNFTTVMKNYIRNAKNSKMEDNGRHIFFLINKIDNFSRKDIEKAKNELKTVLNGVLTRPKIYSVSAYYAMISKLFKTGAITIQDIQKDKKIVIQEKDYPITGKALNEKHIKNIFEKSNIQYFEKDLEKYLEKKNLYLIINLGNAISNVINNSIELKTKRIEKILASRDIDHERFEEHIHILENDIVNIEENERKSITNELYSKVYGNIKGEDCILSKITETFKKSCTEKEITLKRNVSNKWKFMRNYIDDTNATEKLDDFLNLVNSEIEIISKEIMKNTMIIFKTEIENMLKLIEPKFNNLKETLEQTEVNLLGEILSDVGDYKLEHVFSSINEQIDESFNTIVSTIAQNISGDVKKAIKECETYKKKQGILTGIFDGIKSFLNELFGLNIAYSTQRIFDIEKFKSCLDEIIKALLECISEVINKDLKQKLAKQFAKPVKQITNEIEIEVQNIISNIIQNKKALIDILIKDMQSNAELQEENIEKLKQEKLILQQFLEEYNETLNLQDY